MASVDSRHSISLTPIALEDSYEGEHVETNDYYFEKIGEPVPVKLNDSIFDPGSPPSQPLAVSESFGLIFVAHLSGFFVVRTTDVVASAKEMKNGGTGSSIQDLSIVDVSVGKVHVLALSNDNSFLAAVVAGDVHLFSVDSLLDKAEKPYFSCSTTDSSCIKDFKWTRKPENSYLVLSKHGKLYQGSASVPFKHIMHDIDAVECSVKGKFIAVAKKDTLSIFSYKFKERLSMSLLPSSGNGDTDTDFAMKVDSIKWVRADCIIIGCFQVTATGDEEDYFVQVIRSKDGKITDVSSNKVLLSFHDIYSGFTPDILPVETGPCLLLSYLDKCKLAIVANRNNTDQHIVLLGWLQEVENEVAVIDIERDKSLPRIELQDNGDDNLVMGLCIDRVSLPGKVEVQVGNEEIREVSPYCTLLCLTLEGKLLLFHFSSANESEASDETVSACDEEEEDDTVVPTDDQPQLFSNIDQRPVSEVDESPVITRESNAKSQQMDSFAFSQPLKPSTLERPNNEIGNFTKPVKSFTGLGSVAFSGQSVDVPSQSLKSSILERPNNEIGNFNKPFHKFTGLGSVAFSGQSVDMANQSLKPSFLERPNNQIGNFDKPVQKFTGLGSVAFSEQSADVPSHPFLNVKESTIKQSSGAANAFTGFAGKPFQPKDVPSTLTQSGRQVSAGAGKIESLPVIQSSQVSLQDNFSLGKISNKKQDGSERNYGNVPLAKPMTEMCEGLDMLLESIEEPGGFLDACTTFQKSSVEALELGLATLSDQCQIWRRTMTERAQEVQNLFDRTVEVLSKKTYIEGIVTQASDSNYWEHWDRQKLSSELELKRQRILQMNQNMTNQLIELERHFNGLELNKFGGNEEIQVNERTLQRKFGSSRQSHSLHSLNNIMGSQLAAAQLLSDNLSKQIATLNIESPSSKRQSITKELFETIGITYDASFSSPNVNKIPETSSKKLLLSADSFSSKDTSRRKQRSGAKISETETGRRRRDSLDRNLASVQPPKTTVKRMILQGTPLSNEKQFRSPTLEGPATIARPASRIPSSMLSSSSKNAEQGSENPATPFSWASPPRQKFQPLQKTNGTAPSSLPVFQSSHEMVKKSNSEAYSAASENKFAEVTYPEKSKASDFFSLARSDSVQKSNMNFEQKSSIFVTSSKPMSTPKDSIETLNPNSQKTANVKERLTTPSPLFGSANKPEPVSVGTTSLVPTVDGLRKTEEKKPPTVFSPSVPAPAPVNTPPSASTLFSGSPLSKSFPSPAAVVDLNKPLSTSTQSSFASPVVSVSDSLFQAPKMVSPPSNLSSLNPTLVSSSKEQPMPKSDADTEKQAPASKPESRELKLQPSVTLAVGNHVEPTSVTQTVSKDVGGHVPFVVADAQPQQSSAAFVPLPTPNSTSKAAANGKSETSDALITQDDDMDEEAPETNNVEFSLSSLGGFGTTSTPMSNAPKPNPFGGSFGNVNATSMNSSFTTASPPSGELFRPASFSFQSPLASQAASQPTNSVAFSGSFGSGMATQAPAQGGFGQPAQIGVGQQALGTVLGSFGQSRQLGPSLPGTASGSPGGFNGGGFTSVKPVGGGFAGVGSGGGGGFGGGGFSGGGFAGAASTGGGFAGASPPTGGFAGATGGGFAGAAGGGFAGAAGGGFAGAAGGFGAFGNQQGSGGFSAFGAAPGGSGGTGKPPELFTQIRK